MIKEKLLQCDEFIDNEYLDKYIDLVSSNKFRKKEAFKTQQHHIIPRAYFKHHNLEVDNCDSNLVNLLYKDHVLAHFYLSMCTTGKTKYANQNAIFHVLGNINYLKLPTYDAEKLVIISMDRWQENVEDMLRTRSRLYTGRHCKPNTEKHKQQISEKNRGAVYVRKIIDGQWVSKKAHNKDEFDSYIAEGWERGNIPRNSCKCNVGEKISKAKKNKKCINNGIVNKYVDAEDVEKYLTQGWKLGGHSPYLRKSIIVYKLDRAIQIFEDDLPDYELKGWRKEK